jgi:polyisoprenoid-binding protein YceI
MSANVRTFAGRSRLILGAGLIICIILVSLSMPSGEPRKLVAETNHSTIQFSVPISEGLTRITGKFTEFTIDVELIDDDITKSRISSVIKINSINTGSPGRDEDLKSKDFFETEKFPDIKFESTRIEKNGNEFIARGLLEMHGVTKSIELPFKITGKKGEDVIGFSSRYTIKRSDFGVGTEWKHTLDDKFIGDEIGVEIDFWTKKAKAKK